MKQGENRAGRW